MNDISHALKAKTDQLNADDLVDGPIVVTVTGVTVKRVKEQPVWIHFDGDDGKPYKPCKSMLRVLANVWTKNSSTWAGKSMRLFRDPDVRYGGVAEGGIRISHVSDINSATTIRITETRANKKPFTVSPLVFDELAERAARVVATIGNVEPTAAKLAAIRKKVAPLLDDIAKANRDDLKMMVETSITLLASQIKPETENA